jgi:hypothetical protein
VLLHPGSRSLTIRVYGRSQYFAFRGLAFIPRALSRWMRLVVQRKHWGPEMISG